MKPFFLYLLLQRIKQRHGTSAFGRPQYEDANAMRRRAPIYPQPSILFFFVRAGRDEDERGQA